MALIKGCTSFALLLELHDVDLLKQSCRPKSDIPVEELYMMILSMVAFHLHVFYFLESMSKSSPIVLPPTNISRLFMNWCTILLRSSFLIGSTTMGSSTFGLLGVLRNTFNPPGASDWCELRTRSTADFVQHGAQILSLDYNDPLKHFCLVLLGTSIKG
ncbi:hypothetical protein M0R45_019901 [Rubus argutus]|uniref:Uncharacterized protein n=1 Tax=Rubus argutus TaxID=59490 RepID=A0AAW1X8V6_RUBAR